MRSSVSYMLSHGSGEPTMSHPDYEQHAYHHGCLLVLVRGIGPSKPRSLQKIFERLQKVNNVKVTDANGQVRDIWVRFLQEHPVENNDWGDFQTHRRLLGLITVGKFDTQSELNELCRVHESLKVKYTNTLFDSRCLLFGSSTTITTNNHKPASTPSIPTDSLNSYDSSNSASTDGGVALRSFSSTGTNSNHEDSLNGDDSSMQKLNGSFVKPSLLQSQAFFYTENDACVDLEAHIVEFVNSLFWILESKRLKKSQEKIDKVVLLQAPFEKKDFVGLDLDTRNNRKRCMGRVTKNLADLTLQAGLVAESLTLYHAASETLRAISDSLWQGAASEGLCAASAILLYPNCQSPATLQRNASLPIDGTTANNKSDLTHSKRPVTAGIETNDAVMVSPINSASSSTSSVSSMLLSTSSSGGTLSANDPANILPPDEIVARYRDAIINYSKYRHAGIIETEAALKAARICIEQRRNIDVSMFLQNVLYINLTMSEHERVRRFETLTQLYQDIGYHRKAAFCQRLAAWRHVAQSNSNPDWAQNYKLMLDSFGGHRLALDPIEVLQNNAGWPCLQIDLLQQLVAAARRLGQSALATRHMTFLLQTMWRHLTAIEQREMALQLQSLSAQCEGAPVPLVLEMGTVIPPANLTDLPRCEMFVVKELASHLRPLKMVSQKVECSPFLFTPIHFNQNSVDRRQTKRDYSKIAFQWIQNDLCEVTVRLKNLLPFELHVSDMRLLTNGVVFESLPQTVILAPLQPTLVTLHGTPIEHGALEIQGYSTHALGVKSNCRLKAMFDRTFPPNYLVDVLPALPTLQLATSLPQTATFTGMPNADSVIVSASATIFNGESIDCIITLTNNSAVPITYLDESLQSTLDAKLQKQIFTWSHDELQSKLPIAAQSSVDFKVTIYADADFLGPVIGIGSPYPPHPMSNDGPSSLNTHYASGHASLPSRVSSPVNHMLQRRTDVSSSFRSTQSGHSSLATISLGAAAAGCSTVRHLDVQFRFRYSGGGGQQEGYCRQCAVSFNLEFMPSAQVTNWDVLPAEIPSQFYLVLDVINLTSQEMTLNYTASKNIIIEAKETCRIPVPVEKCPLDRLQAIEQSEQNQTSMMSYGTECDLFEKACSEHISDQVNLNWTLSSTDTKGLCSLRGIALSSTMLSLITVAPLQWEIFINNAETPSQAEVSCVAGQSFTLGVKITNLSPTILQQLQLTVHFYQDYQNGIQNFKLETRVILSGPDQTLIAKLDRNASAFHECSAIFFTPGRFKANIQCVSRPPPIGTTHKPTSHIAHLTAFNQSTAAPVHKTRLGTDDESQVWRFIPPLDITVTE